MQDIFEELNKLYEANEQNSEQASDEEMHIFDKNIEQQIEAENKGIEFEVNKDFIREYEDNDPYPGYIPEAKVRLKTFKAKGKTLIYEWSDEWNEWFEEYAHECGGSDDYGYITKSFLANFNLDDFLAWVVKNYKEDLLNDFEDHIHEIVEGQYPYEKWQDCDLDITVYDDEYYRDMQADMEYERYRDESDN